jgi:hypothetical protein
MTQHHESKGAMMYVDIRIRVVKSTLAVALVAQRKGLT